MASIYYLWVFKAVLNPSAPGTACHQV